MRVFVTGGSGWIGSFLVPELLANGHAVVALARSDESAAALHTAGAAVIRGSLEDLGSLRAGAEEAEAVIHLAFIHDFSQYEAANAADRDAVAAFGEVLANSDRPLVITSGTATTAVGRPSTEDDPPPPGLPRSEATNLTLALADRGVRSAVVRLPPTVHGTGDKGFVAQLVGIARDKGVSAYIGDGANRWPAVHRDDAAQLYRLVVEHAPAGSVWNAVGDEGVPTRAIAEVIGAHLDVPVESIAAEDASAHFGFVGFIFGLDMPASSALTRGRLGWEPTRPGLLEDLAAGHYFG